MTLFYLKWEEFFGAWLEKHGQSILIVYGLDGYEAQVGLGQTIP